MVDLKLIFCDPAKEEDEFELQYALYDTHIAMLWLTALDHAYNGLNGKIDNSRFYNFKTNEYTTEKIIDKINKNIDIINKHWPGLIDYKVTENMSEDDHNRLHIFFEKYRGPLLNPHPFYKKAPWEYQQAMRVLNILIHRWEYKQKYPDKKRATIQILGSPRYPIEKKHNIHFTMTNSFGDIMINYCEVGKHLADLFADNDVHVGDDNVKPQRYYSADFFIRFYGYTEEEKKKLYDDFDEWFDRNSNYLIKLGFNKNDPNNALGYIPVAKLINPCDNEYIIENIEKRQFLKRIEIL